MATVYTDVCGSIARRAKQDEKDDAERARRARSTPRVPGIEVDPTGPFWNLRAYGQPITMAAPLYPPVRDTRRNRRRRRARVG